MEVKALLSIVGSELSLRILAEPVISTKRKDLLQLSPIVAAAFLDCLRIVSKFNHGSQFLSILIF